MQYNENRHERCNEWRIEWHDERIDGLSKDQRDLIWRLIKAESDVSYLSREVERLMTDLRTARDETREISTRLISVERKVKQ